MIFFKKNLILKLWTDLNIIIHKNKVISISRNFCNETLIWIVFNYNFKISICKIFTKMNADKYIDLRF